MASTQGPAGGGQPGGHKKTVSLSEDEFEVDSSGNLHVKSHALDKLVSGAAPNARAANMLRPGGGAGGAVRPGPANRAISVSVTVDL